MKQSFKKLLLTVPLCVSLGSLSARAQDAAPAADANLAKRAAAMPSLAHLPASTEGVISIQNLNGIFGEIVGSNVFQRVLELSGESGDDAQQGIEMARTMLDKYAGQEIIIAYADGCVEEVENWMGLYHVYVSMTYGSMGRSIAQADFDQLGEPDFSPEMIQAELKKSLGDPKSQLSKSMDKAQMPPLLIASKMPDATTELLAQIDELEGQLPPFITVSKFDVAGSPFKSWSIELKDVFDENAEAQMAEFLGDKATSERVAKAIRGKRVEISFGALGDYLVVGVGKDRSHLNFVDDPSQSLVSKPHFAKLDPYMDKPVHGVVYMEKGLLESDDSMALFQTAADSFVDGLSSGNAGGGIMKKLGNKLKAVASQVMRLSERDASDYVGIMYGGNGLQGEGFGGWMSKSLAGKKKLKFANASKDAFMVMANVTNPEYDEVSIELLETMASIVPICVDLYGRMSQDENATRQFEEMEKVFGPKLQKIWTITRDKFFAGLGNDSAMIVDLNGSLPKIPGVPRVIVNQGKAPRIAMANDVRDRAKLSAAWAELVPAANDLMAAIPGQEKGAEAQMPDVLSSEKDGLATHYFPLPLLSNDFMPSMSVSDDLFFMSTSKKFSESLAANVGKGGGDLRGIYLKMDFTQANDFADGWLKLIQDNKETVFGDNEFAMEDFEEGAAIAEQVLKLTRALKSFHYNKYTTDANEPRSTWHLHLEDVK